MSKEPIVDFYQGDDFSTSLTLHDYIQIGKKRLPIILTVLVVIFVLTVINSYKKVPLYKAESQVLIERNRGKSGLDFQYFYYDPDFLNTQAEIIMSENVAKRAVNNLQLVKKYRSYFFKEDKLSKSFFALSKEFIQTNLARLLDFVDKRDGGKKGGDRVKESETMDIGGKKLSDEDIIASMIQGAISVSQIKNTKIIKINYIHENPVMTELVTNAIVQSYMDVTLEIKHSSSNYSLQWMTAKAAEERKKLEVAEKELQKYVRANDLVTVENRLAIIPRKMEEVSSSLTKAQSDRKELEEVYNQIKNVSGNYTFLESIPLFADNVVLKELREDIYKSKQKIKELSKKYGYKHPVMIKAKDELEILNNERTYEIKRIIASTKNSYELAQSREENLQKLLASSKAEMMNVNEKFIQYSMMKRDVETIRVLYDALTTNIKKESVTEQSQNVNFWVVAKATRPEIPFSPNKKRDMLLGLVLGVSCGVGFAFVVEFLDNTVRSEKDLTTRYNLTVLGTVEQVKESGEDIESYINRNPLSPLAESYRLIRSGLLLSSAEHPPRSILVTSMSPKEGKTSTLSNIARILSQDGKKVLVIDCDLRKPRLHSLFSMDNKMGLSNYLSGNLVGNLISSIPGEDIKLIPSGLIPPNPAELLNSVKMKRLVEAMNKKFDFVLLDSPPIQRVTDSLALSQVVEGTIIVVRAKKTTFEMLQSGMKKMSDVNTNFLGFVLNGMSKSDSSGGYYAGYNTYYAKDDA